MKYSAKLSDALHILVFIALYTEGVTSTRIAESVHTHPSYVRQMMSRLKAAGIISTKRGSASACLLRSAQDISMLDVYHAVEGDKPLLHLDIHTNPDCGVGINIQYAVGEFYQDVQKAAYEVMGRISLQDIIARYQDKVQACRADAVSEHEVEEA